jgi:L-seryl-tRNA(Ser) seleniumtransferase
MSLLKSIPSVDSILKEKEIKARISLHGRDVVVYSIRAVLNSTRAGIKEKKLRSIFVDNIVQEILKLITLITSSSLKPVVNGTGIILHTNLGRAPFGETQLNRIIPVLKDYTNLEFDTDKGKRGKRISHLVEILKYLTKAEDAIVVNNNAAAVMLVLNALAKKKEVLVSRGELIEIGGSFRMPDIMQTSNAKMIEVGTTNRTRIADYEKAINEKTKVIFKAHKSNYTIDGFTEEVNVQQLSNLAKKYNLILVYDLGSGLLKKNNNLPFQNEPDAQSSLKDGADLVTFSCDKLLGGPQAGIIAGKKDIVQKLSKSPLMRALRVDKLTISMLAEVLKCYLNEKQALEEIPTLKMLNSSKRQLKTKAKKLVSELNKYSINSQIVPSSAQTGGGTLPNLKIDSFSVLLDLQNQKKNFQQKVYHKLLQFEKPILANLFKGNIQFDVLTINDNEIDYLAKSISACL